jgi:hypothetical protein
MIVYQPSMLMPGKKGLEKVPYQFKYRYRCAGEPGCRGHEQSIVDWEIAEAFRRWREQYGEFGALERIEKKWTEQVWASDRDTALFVPRVGSVLAAEAGYRWWITRSDARRAASSAMTPRWHTSGSSS